MLDRKVQIQNWPLPKTAQLKLGDLSLIILNRTFKQQPGSPDFRDFN
jgi:hypothetical protein